MIRNNISNNKNKYKPKWNEFLSFQNNIKSYRKKGDTKVGTFSNEAARDQILKNGLKMIFWRLTHLICHFL